MVKAQSLDGYLEKSKRHVEPRNIVKPKTPAEYAGQLTLSVLATNQPSPHACFGRLNSFSLIFGIAGSAVERSTDCSRAGGGGVEAGVAVVDRLRLDLPNLILKGASWLGVSRLAAATCPGACHFGGRGFVLTFSVRRKRRWP